MGDKEMQKSYQLPPELLARSALLGSATDVEDGEGQHDETNEAVEAQAEQTKQPSDPAPSKDDGQFFLDIDDHATLTHYQEVKRELSQFMRHRQHVVEMCCQLAIDKHQTAKRKQKTKLDYNKEKERPIVAVPSVQTLGKTNFSIVTHHHPTKRAIEPSKLGTTKKMLLDVHGRDYRSNTPSHVPRVQITRNEIPKRTAISNSELVSGMSHSASMVMQTMIQPISLPRSRQGTSTECSVSKPASKVTERKSQRIPRRTVRLNAHLSSRLHRVSKRVQPNNLARPRLALNRSTVQESGKKPRPAQANKNTTRTQGKLSLGSRVVKATQLFSLYTDNTKRKKRSLFQV